MAPLNTSWQWEMYESCGGLEHPSCTAAVWIMKTVPVVLIIIGTCGNLLSVAILSRRRMRTLSTTLYLLALSDLIFLWTGALRTAIALATGFDIMTLSSLNCAVHRWVSTTAGSVCIWMLVVLTVERMLYTRTPVVAKRRFTRTKAAAVLGVLVAVFLACFSHHAYGFRLKPKLELVTNATADTLHPKLMCTFSSLEYEVFFKHTFNVFVLFVVNVIPFIIIVTGTMTIAITLLQQRRKRRN